MFCCLCPQKVQHVEIFRRRTPDSPLNHTKNTKLLTSSEQEKAKDLGKSALCLASALEATALEKQGAIRKKENKMQRDTRLMAEQVFDLLAPIDGMDITHQEVSQVLLELPSWVEGTLDYWQDYSAKMIRKSNYADLAKKYGGRGEDWKDPDFPHNQFYEIGNLRLKWENFSVLSKRIGKSVQLFDGFPEPRDIVQGAVGDCYFVSAVAGLTSYPRRLLRLFPSLNARSGILMARLMFKGILQEVVVDQYFPYIAETQELLGCRPCKKQSEIYVMTLEKCWAKLWGSYAEIDRGFPHEALRALTGAPTKNYFLGNEASDPLKSASFFQKILDYDKKKFVMCTGTNKKGKVRINHRQRGNISIDVESEHIYSVVQVREEDQQKLVKIYNPWGHNRISGSEGQSMVVTGQFIIKWSEFVKQFFYLTVCKINEYANYLFLELQGCKQNSFRFIQMEVRSQSPATYALVLSETDRKDKHNYGSQRYICVTFVVLREHEGGNYELLAMKSTYKYSDHYLELANLPSCKLLVAIYFSEVAIKEALTFSVYSQGWFGFKERKVDHHFEDHFFSKVLLSHSHTAELPCKYPNPRSDKVSVTFRTLVSDTILGYYLIRVDKDSPASFTVKMSKRQFDEIGLVLLPPYNSEQIEVSAMPGHETIVVMMAKDFEEFQNIDTKYYSNNKRHIHEDLIFGESFAQVK